MACIGICVRPALIVLPVILHVSCARAPEGTREGGASPSSAKVAVDFASEVQPIFDAHCVSCHTGATDDRLGLLPSSSLDYLMSGGSQADEMPLVDPGEPDNSYLIAKMRGQQLTVAGGEGLPMPPHGLLDDSLVSVVETWISEGAPGL